MYKNFLAEHLTCRTAHLDKCLLNNGVLHCPTSQVQHWEASCLQSSLFPSLWVLPFILHMFSHGCKMPATAGPTEIQRKGILGERNVLTGLALFSREAYRSYH